MASTCIHILHVHSHLYMHTHTHTSTFTLAYTSTHTYKCVYVHIHVCAHIHMHTHAHPQTYACSARKLGPLMSCSPWEMEVGGSEIPCLPWLHRELEASLRHMRPCLKDKNSTKLNSLGEIATSALCWGYSRNLRL